MKTVSRMWRAALSMTLVICMIIGFCPAAAFAVEANEDVLHYVSLGASNTNGYGHDGYLPAAVYEDPLAASKDGLNVYGYNRAPAAAYPAQIAAQLKAETGKNVQLHQLALSSMRVEEVRYLLDETMEPDAYMKWRFTGGQAWFNIAEPGGVSALRQAYQDALTNADYVTVDLGWNNFGVFAFNQVKVILVDGRYWKDVDMATYMDLADAEGYQQIKAVVKEKLAEYLTGADANLGVKLEMMTDVLVAATVGACYNYDIVMEKIYGLNPDATVSVITIQNLADDLVVEAGNVKLRLGDLYGELIDLVNLYRATLSPYADKCVYADAGDVTTFLDEMVAWDGDPATLSGDTKDCFDMYDDSLYARSIVEYVMVGQALSGVFKGFRDMAAQYGLEAFKDDEQYTYEFALNRSAGELLTLDLAALDFRNPGGDDQDVELYGAAVAEHLKNLRAKNLTAYNYVFENLLEGLNAQKAQLEPVKDLPAYAELYAQLTQAIDMIVPAAKAEFDAKLEGVYNTYVNTLNYAYDMLATIFQAAAEKNELVINASSLEGFDSASDKLMGAIINSFLGGAQNKFYYELQKNNIQNTGVTEDPAPMVDEVLRLLEDPAVASVAVLAVRYELGNSFFAHPNTTGHDEITAAVMRALREGSQTEEFINVKIERYIQLLKENCAKLSQMINNSQELGELGELATRGELVLGENSTYVALGDSTAVADGYAELVAAGLDIKNIANYAAAGNTVSAVMDELDSYTKLADADLVTIGFSNVTLLQNAFTNALADEDMTYDWSSLVGDELAPYAESVLAEGCAMLADLDMGADISAMLETIMESVAYDAVAYAVTLPKLVTAIRSVNEDATIVIVGQYNPMKGVSLKLGEKVLEISEYLDYFVKGVAIHGIAYAVATGEAIFVNASEVETKNTDMEWSITDLAKMLMKNFENLNPSAAGDAYIAGKIMDALTVKIAEDPEILKGDVDDNGKVTLRDAILVLKSVNGGTAVDAANADVDGNSKVNLRDAILILQLANGKATK